MVLGGSFAFAGQTVPADMKAFNESKEFVKFSEKLIKDGKIKLPNIKVIKGLEGIPAALRHLW